MDDDRHEGSLSDGDPQTSSDQGLSDGESARARERASRLRDLAALSREDIAKQRDLAALSREDIAKQRDESSSRRDGSSSHRDESSLERDESSTWRDEVSMSRDEVADGHDQEASDLDARDDLADRHTLRVEELRDRSRSGRTRAADDRARARQDREHSEGDREHAGDDREHSGGDREHSEGDREQAGRDREHAEGDRGHAEEDREHSEGDRDLAGDDREHAGTDDLTGARRRGVGIEELENEIKRARRESDSRLVAAFIDVDGLKAVNDIEGHNAGDALLRHIAERIRRQMRSYDLFVRLGGDEFLCALPNVTLVETQARFDRLRSDLAGSGSPVSIGCAELRDGDSADDLVNRADGALLASRGTSLRA
jgi:diguanylate cyclase (GGDEF)-like protein